MGALTTTDPKKLRADAAAALAKGNHRKALALFEELGRKEPGDPLPFHRAGEIYRRLGRNLEAVERLRRAADLYAKQGFLVKAIAVCKIILEVEPGHTETQAELSGLYARRREEGPAPARPAQAPGPPRETAARASEIDELPSIELDEPGRRQFNIDLDTPGIQPPTPEISFLGARPAPARAPALPNEAPVQPEAAAPPKKKRSASEIRGAVPRIPPALAGTASAAPPLAPAPSEPVPLEAVSLGGMVEGARRVSGPDLGSLEEALEIVIDEEEPAVVAPAPRALPRTPLFSALDEGTLRALIERISHERRAPGETIARQGEVGDSLYVVADGEVAIIHEGPPQREVTRLGEGAFFGEIAVVTNFPRTATVVATRETELLRLSREVIWELVRDHPGFLTVLLGFVRDRLLDTLLCTSPLFLAVPPADRRPLASRFRLLEVEAERDLLRQGECTEALFLLLAGRAELVREQGGARSVIGEVGPGAILGEVSMLLRAPATATVQTRTRCWALSMGRAAFSEVLMTYPTVLEYVNELAHQRRMAIERLQLD
jgi:CRP-like cAMP-binding protein